MRRPGPFSCANPPVRNSGGFAVYVVRVRPRLPGPLSAMMSMTPVGGAVLWSDRAWPRAVAMAALPAVRWRVAARAILVTEVEVVAQARAFVAERRVLERAALGLARPAGAASRRLPRLDPPDPDPAHGARIRSAAEPVIRPGASRRRARTGRPARHLVAQQGARHRQRPARVDEVVDQQDRALAHGPPVDAQPRLRVRGLLGAVLHPRLRAAPLRT